MSLKETEIAELITRFIKGDYSDQDEVLLKQWAAEDEKNQRIFEELQNSKSLEQDLLDYNSFDKAKAWEIFESRHFPKANIYRLFTKKFIWTASVIFIIGTAYILFQLANSKDQVYETIKEGVVLKDSIGEILPATTGAFLISSKGEKVELNSSFEINASGNVILDNEKDELDGEFENEVEEYELVVPKAKVIHFTLFDGSKIWVNANSRLKIPSKFNNAERRLKLISGEVYLEVEKYQGAKFIVETQNGDVEVLGTKFNVNSTNSYFKTTLIEGSVKLSSENAQSILAPNTSGVLYNGTFVISQANLLSDLAWKNNIFYFNNFTIKRIARQIENWYGVKVRIENDIIQSKETYSGEIRRDVKLTEIKKMLEFISGLDVSIEGDGLNIE